MSVEQAAFALAGAVCIVGSVIAAAYRGPRMSGIALVGTLVALAVLYVELGAPAVAVFAIVLVLLAIVPFVVRLRVPAARRAAAEPGAAALALLVGGTVLAILAVAIVQGEVPLNVSLRSGDGYDVAALTDVVTGRSAVAAGASGLVLLAALVAARAARRGRRTRP